MKVFEGYNNLLNIYKPIVSEKLSKSVLNSFELEKIFEYMQNKINDNFNSPKFFKNINWLLNHFNKLNQQEILQLLDDFDYILSAIKYYDFVSQVNDLKDITYFDNYKLLNMFVQRYVKNNADFHLEGEPLFQKTIILSMVEDITKTKDWFKIQYDYFQKYDKNISKNPNLAFKLGEVFFRLFKKLGRLPSFNEFEDEVIDLDVDFVNQGFLDDVKNKVKSLLNMFPDTFFVLQVSPHKVAFFESEKDLKNLMSVSRYWAIVIKMKKSKDFFDKFQYVVSSFTELKQVKNPRNLEEFKKIKNNPFLKQGDSLDIRRLFDYYRNNSKSFSYAPNLLKKLKKFWEKAFRKGLDDDIFGA